MISDANPCIITTMLPRVIGLEEDDTNDIIAHVALALQLLYTVLVSC